jgi:hypothetical protein
MGLQLPLALTMVDGPGGQLHARGRRLVMNVAADSSSIVIMRGNHPSLFRKA